MGVGGNIYSWARIPPRLLNLRSDSNCEGYL